jgi:stage II sporulation protein AB (anti-sigma F factor)
MRSLGTRQSAKPRDKRRELVVEGKFFTIRLQATPENLGAIRRVIDVYLNGEDELSADVQLAVTEAVSNTIRHGYDGDGPGYVTVELRQEGDLLCVSVADDGRGLAGADPETSGSGLGLPLIKTLSETMEIADRESGGTSLTATFRLD